MSSSCALSTSPNPLPPPPVPRICASILAFILDISTRNCASKCWRALSCSSVLIWFFSFSRSSTFPLSILIFSPALSLCPSASLSWLIISSILCFCECLVFARVSASHVISPTSFRTTERDFSTSSAALLASSLSCCSSRFFSASIEALVSSSSRFSALSLSLLSCSSFPVSPFSRAFSCSSSLWTSPLCLLSTDSSERSRDSMRLSYDSLAELSVLSTCCCVSRRLVLA
mmetsp:Transcript_6928/g.12748  ORF Transcript_6928/g.12748 Transcript_6928/m.12748 type:complete len:230 (-) Transcript_6928:2700-3389(-)